MEISAEEKLQERVKELSCLYAVLSALSKPRPVAEVLTTICAILQQAWRFSENAVAELKIDEYHLFSSAIPKESIFQQCNFPEHRSQNGYLKIHYPASTFSKEDFLEEEQKLLDNVAIEISGFLEKEHHRKNEELLKRSAERNDRLSILGEITAGIAHELNTPLGNILGFAELIEQRTQELQTKKDSSKIIKAAIFSREVVKKLMFFACEMPQNMEIISIKPIISQALSLLGQNFKKAGVFYTFDYEQADLKAQFDSIQLTQVLFNILINAIYAAPNGSEIHIQLTNDEHNFYIEISDKGPGIPKEIKHRIFEPFFTTKPVGEGSGLGLSVVHGIIKSHRGDILCQDNHPTGALFRIQLPLKN